MIKLVEKTYIYRGQYPNGNETDDQSEYLFYSICID